LLEGFEELSCELVRGKVRIKGFFEFILHLLHLEG
jgi:hypothetical protein